MTSAQAALEDRKHAECARLSKLEKKLKKIVDEQADDDGLWFKAQTAPEAYLQQELRRLHRAIEGEE